MQQLVAMAKHKANFEEFWEAGNSSNFPIFKSLQPLAYIPYIEFGCAPSSIANEREYVRYLLKGEISLEVFLVSVCRLISGSHCRKA